MQKLTLLIVIALLSACGGSHSQSHNDSVANNLGAVSASDDSACFWQGPYSKDNPKTNFAYPDTGATYWSARYTLPVGATLTLNGQYPYARYSSFNSYRADASPADAISDADIEPNAGSTNPFINGHKRLLSERNFSLNVLAGERPSGHVDKNHLYSYVKAGKQATLLYRVYVPNKGKSASGGVALPSIKLTQSDGNVLTGKAACNALKVQQKRIAVPLFPAKTYAFARQNNPAKNPPIWRAAYNPQFTIQCAFLGNCNSAPKRQVAWFANLDNQYIAAYIDRNIKEIAVTRGQIPKVVKTLNANPTFITTDAQLRYWSICQNEFYSQKVTDRLYDEQISINADGKYTIVTSLPSARPTNANKKCGVEFLPWSAQGDGFALIPGQANHATDGLLIVRNMKPLNGFKQSIQKTKTPGDEKAVLGAFFPTTTYYSKAEFEALDCQALSAGTAL